MASITPTAIPQGVRTSRFASTRLLGEWSAMQNWYWGPVYEMRLGPTPLAANGNYVSPTFDAALRRFNRYADLVGVTQGKLLVVEAKIILDPGAISQLQHYVDLVSATPLLREFAGYILQPRLLVAINDPIVAQRAASQGIAVEVYTPAWINQWLARKYRPPIPTDEGNPPAA